MQENKEDHGLVLILTELQKPEPGLGEILIHVHAAGVTPTELLWYPTTHTKSGTARVRPVPGHEFSGVITAVSKDVQDFEIGDEVYGMNDWFVDGATAKFCITLPQNIARKPTTLSHEAAASVPISRVPHPRSKGATRDHPCRSVSHSERRAGIADLRTAQSKFLPAFETSTGQMNVSAAWEP